MKQLAVMGILALMILLGVRCSPDHGEENESHHLLEQLKHVSVDSLDYDFSRYDHVDKEKLIEIHQLVDGAEQFLIPDRLEGMKSYPCSHCHSKSLRALQADNKPGEKKSHWDIEVNHASASTMQCNTCHNPDNFDQLHSLTGEQIDFNHSYQLCGQCHSTQMKDWLGGAHGKQVGGWSKPRVSQTCTGCHNPHNPSFEKRLPARFNTEWLK